MRARLLAVSCSATIWSPAAMGTPMIAPIVAVIRLFIPNGVDGYGLRSDAVTEARVALMATAGCLGSKGRGAGSGLAELSASLRRRSTKGDAMTATLTEQRTTAPTRWTIDPDESFVEFAVKTFWGVTTVRGRFDRFDGTYEVGPRGTTIELTIDADSLDTGNGTRDKHLHSADFFGIAEHPKVRFTSTRVHDVNGGILHVVGRLEAAGNVVLLEFPATLRAVGDGLEVEATTTVDQSQLGMSSGRLGMIRRPATLHVKAHLSL
jgi:polyisoprenoid-binding protein YceI